MKKISAILIAIILVLTLTACGSNSNTDNGSQGSNEQSIPTESNISSDTTSENVDSEYENEEAIPLTNIKINYKNRTRRYSVAEGNVYCVNDDSLAAIIYSIAETYTGDIDGALDMLIKKYMKTTYSYANGTIEDSSLQVVSKEKVSIAGFESIKFAGNINNTLNDCYTYGYVFVIDNVPCMVIGMVSTANQEQSLIDEMVKDIDTMASTIRTEQ